MQISGFEHIPAPHVSYEVGVRYYEVSSSADTLSPAFVFPDSMLILFYVKQWVHDSRAKQEVRKLL